VKQVKEFFDRETSTLTYLLWDDENKDVIIIDPVMDYDPASSTVKNESVQNLIDFIKTEKLKAILILETHVHTNHLNSSQFLKVFYPDIKMAIGSGITKVQEIFKKIYNFPELFKTDGSQFDKLLSDNEIFKMGSFEIKVISTPGHTPACSSYLIEDCLFVGDTIFMPDSGTGRCDFPAGSAEDLYHSIHEKIFKLPPTTKIYVGHDYMPNDRTLEFVCTLSEQKDKNIHLRESTTQEEFVRMRRDRDKTLTAPKLLLPSIQVNMAGGKVPAPESNGQRYLKIPISFM
jgi:glyoxylase-like metal-dependent hydrolase (beta-lactamase superfamily II)